MEDIDELSDNRSLLNSGIVLLSWVLMSMKEIKSIKQSILKIDFDWSSWNDKGKSTFSRFGISKYDQYSIFRNTLQCHWTSKIETKYFRIDGC